MTTATQASLRRWTAWTVRQIANVVVSEGLDVGLAQVVRGPTTLSFRLRLTRPNPRDLRKVLSLGPALAQSLQTDAVRVVDTAGGVVVEVPSPSPRTPTGPELAQHTERFRVCLGLDQWRQPAVVDMTQNPAVVFVGPSRRGKSSAMRAGLYALTARAGPARFRYVVIAEKRGDWTAFDGLAGCLGIVSDVDEAADALAWASEDLLTGRAEGRRPRYPGVLVIVDDLIALLERRRDLAGYLARIASMGGGVNVFLWLGTQDAGAKAATGGMSVEANLTARLVYKPATATAAARAAGTGQLGLDQLSQHRGDCLFILDGVPTRIATGHVDDGTVVQLPSGDGAGCRPWLEHTTRNRQTTDRNRPQPGQPPVVAPPGGRHGDDDGGDGVGPVATVAPVVADLGVVFPIPKRPPEGDEVRAVVALRDQGLSLSAICRTVYGFKDGDTFTWIKGVIEDKPAETGQQDSGVPAVLDLGTEDGRRTLEKLRTSGLLSWPDPETLVTETQHAKDIAP
jgi:hypothetical protein